MQPKIEPQSPRPLTNTIATWLFIPGVYDIYDTNTNKKFFMYIY